MTIEEHNLLVENNLMLKKLLQCVQPKDEVTQNEFIANIVANLISNRLDR